jgi:hypothetical protein
MVQCIISAVQGGEDMIVDVPKSIMVSKHREQIDDMLKEGDSYTAISNWLRNNGEHISRNTISKYHKFCFNINDTAAEIYTQQHSEAKLLEEAEKVVSTLELYDKFIQAGQYIDPSMIDPKYAADLAMKAAKQKEDFLKEHGNQEAEQQTQLLKEIRDELLKSNLKDLIEGMSNDRVKQRLNKAADIA